MVPSYKQKSIRSLACALGIPKSTLFAKKSDTENDAVILSVSIEAISLLNNNDDNAGEETDAND